MAKKTRTELSTSAINTNLPDNTQELITPTTERAQLTDERESVVNYKDDLGGTSNAGKFLTVAIDGESLTMVDAPTGDVTGSGVQYQVAVWDGTNSLTGNAAFQFLTGAQNSIKLIRGTGSGNILFYAADGTTLHGYIENQVSGNGLTIGQQDGLTSAVIDLDDSTITFKTNNNPHLTISSGGDATFNGISDLKIDLSGTQIPVIKPNQALSDISLESTGNGGHVYLKAEGGANSVIIFKNPTGESMRISSGGLATFASGIKFGTGATLDAYEEVTATLRAFQWAGASANTQLGTVDVKFTRVGNVVTATCLGNPTVSVTSTCQGFYLLDVPTQFDPTFLQYVGMTMNGSDTYAYDVNIDTTNAIAFRAITSSFTSGSTTIPVGTQMESKHFSLTYQIDLT